MPLSEDLDEDRREIGASTFSRPSDPRLDTTSKGFTSAGSSNS